VLDLQHYPARLLQTGDPKPPFRLCFLVNAWKNAKTPSVKKTPTPVFACKTAVFVRRRHSVKGTEIMPRKRPRERSRRKGRGGGEGAARWRSVEGSFANAPAPTRPDLRLRRGRFSQLGGCLCLSVISRLRWAARWLWLIVRLFCRFVQKSGEFLSGLKDRGLPGWNR